MAATYTRTVNFTNSNPNGGEDYTWQNLDSNATWVTRSAGANANEWNFTIQDNTAQNATTRSTTWKVTHWTYTTDEDLNTWDAFTITQYADGTVQTTALPSPTPATTEATLGTEATTEATLGTEATTQATVATTQPTPATTTQAKTISFTSGNQTVTSGGQSFQVSAQVNSEAVQGKNTGMPTITYKSSGGGGAGQLYWASDASGATPISAPSWITSGTGGTFNSSGTVQMSVSIDPYN